MNVAKVSVFSLSMLLAASSAFSLTCSPLSYQLATDTLRAKWGAPFNLMVQAHKVTVLARYCANNVSRVFTIETFRFLSNFKAF
jgi:hypothetical protein